MNNIYASIILFFNNNNTFDFEKTSKLITKNKKNNINNYFINLFHYNKFMQLEDYNKIFRVLPKNSKVIIDLSPETHYDLNENIKKIKKYNNNFAFSLNISAKFLENYKNGESYIFNYLNEENINIYLEMAPQALEQKEVGSLIKNNNISGIILKTDYDPDLDLTEIEDYKNNNKDLEIIYKSDDFFLTALRNNNSIISSYSTVLIEDFNKIWNSYKNKNDSKASLFQEKLNQKLKLLRQINVHKILKLYYEKNNKHTLKEFICNNRELCINEKNILKRILIS